MAHEPGKGWHGSLASIISSVHVEGTFAWSGGKLQKDVKGPLPKLSVTGVRPISLPLSVSQAAALLASGEPAPYGKGSETVLDPAVRRATQLDASRVVVAPSWEPTLQLITANAMAALGVDEVADVEARLYKLLLYQPGGHFVPHRDTEKEPGMFATLVVQLPVQGGHAGGTLRVSHRDERFKWASAKGSTDRNCGLQYAAFYADCEHELTAVTAGLRMVLVYNLVRLTAGTQLRAPTCKSVRLEALSAAVREWEAAPAGCERLLAVPLEHKYTETNLSLACMKGRDAAVVELLHGCELLDVHLVLLTKRVSGTAQGASRYYAPKRSRREDWGLPDGSGESSDDEDDSSDNGANAAMGEVHDEEIVTNKWVSLSGERVDFGRLDMSLPDRVIGGGELFGEDDEPDDREYEGFTGNYGPTLDFFYHRAVAVIWPRSRSATIACAAGFDAALNLLEKRLASLGLPGELPPQPQPQQPQQQEQPTPAGCGCHEERRRKAQELLQAVLELAEQSPGKCFGGHHAVRALQLASSPPVLALVGGSAAARLLAAIGASEGLSSEHLVRALAQAAARLSAAGCGLDDQLAALMARRLETQFARCVELATEAALPAGLRDRLSQMLMDAALGAGFHRMPQADVVILARLVCGVGGGSGAHFRQHQAAFASLVLARPDSQALLRPLLRDPVVARAAAAGEAPVLAMAAVWMRALEALVARGPPVFSWAQPGVQMPKFPQVEAFLHGPQQQATFAFKNIGQACKWADTFNYSSYRGATAKDGANGFDAFCTVTKNRERFEQQVRTYQGVQKELSYIADLVASAGRGVVGGMAAPCTAAGAAASVAPGGGPAAGGGDATTPHQAHPAAAGVTELSGS